VHPVDGVTGCECIQPQQQGEQPQHHQKEEEEEEEEEEGYLLKRAEPSAAAVSADALSVLDAPFPFPIALLCFFCGPFLHAGGRGVGCLAVGGAKGKYPWSAFSPSHHKK
jgi:hypothetical protein